MHAQQLSPSSAKFDDPPEARQIRSNLVATIATAYDIQDPRVLEALRDVPRHWFTPGMSLDVAYGNYPLPIGHEQTISQPAIVAVMTQALELTGQERVLEIGTGSGYQAAVLSMLAREVYSVELVEALGKVAQYRLSSFGFHNVVTRIGNGYQGWPELAPFDRILLTAAPEELPKALVEQLADGGVLVAPVGPMRFGQILYRLRKRDQTISKEDLGDVRFVPMVHDDRSLA